MITPLSSELERFVQSEVESGHFASREAVIEAALWDMQQRRAVASAADWIEEISGSMQDFPEFEQVLEYGREIRRQQVMP